MKQMSVVKRTEFVISVPNHLVRFIHQFETQIKRVTDCNDFLLSAFLVNYVREEIRSATGYYVGSPTILALFDDITKKYGSDSKNKDIDHYADFEFEFTLFL